MKDLADDIIRRFLKRQPTADDYKRVNELLDLLPPELRSSPGAMVEIVLRAETMRAFEAVLARASFETEQKLLKEFPGRVDDAAIKALNHIRDKLPIDAADRFGRLLRFGALWTAIVITVGAAAGWTASNRSAERYHMTHQAASDATFDQCVDSAEGAAVKTSVSRGNPIEYDPVTYRVYARKCAADYADRRAGAG